MNFDMQRKAALAILSGDCSLSRRAGSFLGQCAGDQTPLSQKQETWFLQLAEKANVEVLTDAC